MDPSNGGDTFCVAPGCSVAQAAGCIERCDDTGVKATFCIGGAPLTIDCTTFAGADFTSCKSYHSKLLDKDVTQCAF
jgi:hypothetical protein